MADNGATNGEGEQQQGTGFEPPLNEGSKANSDDGMLAAIILGAAIAIVIIGGVLYRQWNKKHNNDGLGDLLWESSAGDAGDSTGFQPPKERKSYLDAREKLDTSKPENAVTLKKLLMMRAMKTIPLLYELQNGGPTVDRLYKKGMLTDEMHSRFIQLKQYIDTEFVDVQEEAERLVEGWGQAVWPQANQYYQIHSRQASGKDTNKNPLSSDNGENDDDDDSIVKMLSSSPKKAKNMTAMMSSENNSASPSKKGKIDADEKATANMSDEQKADYYAKKLLLEEEKRNKSNNNKSNKGSKSTSTSTTKK